MKYYVIAGEASGDLHGSNLIRELKQMDQDAVFRGWGGDLMKEEGLELIKHYRDLAFMGFIEVVANLKTILRNLEFCKKDILEFSPDAIILIDYPGFNLRIAAFAKEHGIRVIYYISPQVWAWKASRVKKIKRDVDQMIVILPFEEEFYTDYDMPVSFVGHPLLDAIDRMADQDGKQKESLAPKPIIALLPGSREQEIKTMLPVMLEAIREISGYSFVVAGAPSQPESIYRTIIGSNTQVKLLFGQTYQLLQQSHAALVTSGTATLETALFGVPLVVCYKGSYLSYQIARRLVKVKYISLVNLVMDREVVTELIQDQMNPANIREELLKLLQGSSREHLKSELEELKIKLGGKGASKKAASLIYSYLKNPTKVIN